MRGGAKIFLLGSRFVIQKLFGLFGEPQSLLHNNIIIYDGVSTWGRGESHMKGAGYSSSRLGVSIIILDFGLT